MRLLVGGYLATERLGKRKLLDSSRSQLAFGTKRLRQRGGSSSSGHFVPGHSLLLYPNGCCTQTIRVAAYPKSKLLLSRRFIFEILPFDLS